jgi:hypothetical protein
MDQMKRYNEQGDARMWGCEKQIKRWKEKMKGCKE